ncbi:hypothetical protein GCM10009527_063820 [Actinomadura nitritigenes]|uniref:Uncharacterized protein n=1 Tax=Actinomadura nitritigenes TaxID=134602 RepID=A0ABS3RCY6_9ACTN|nr:hypothetical protein [Actinomadura nitritigenes]MBO2444081.1 hypothetical protein [Actinomadura nitritigenes]
MDRALLFVIGLVNRTVFAVTRGRIVLYRFGGMPAVMVQLEPLGGPEVIASFRDGEDHVLLAEDAEDAEDADGALVESLRSATSARVEAGGRWYPVGIVMVEDGGERERLLKRVLKQASISERYEAKRRRAVPVARLTPQGAPAPDASAEAVSGIRTG